jgi:hypothetical protein
MRPEQLRELGQQLRVDAVRAAAAAAVLEAFGDGSPVPRMVRLAVRDIPASATSAQQLRAAGIDVESIASAARDLVGSQG